ncbi:16659_t:CDS:1, partial [Rhizophagus irregularis]
AIRENVNYISLHGGHGSLTDTKRIIRQYTEESESLAPVIDDLTLQREFIVFDLRRSKSDPLSIRVRWDTSLSSITDQSQFDPSSISVQSPFDPSLNPVRSKFNPSLNPVRSKFSSYGQKAVAEAKKSSQLIEFAREYPSPKERKHLLVSGVIAKNADTWIKYVFREAYGLSGKTLGSDFQNFLAKVRDRTTKTEIPKPETVKELFSRYEVLKSSHPLDNKKIIEGIGVLLQIFSKGHMDRRALR